jgi:hypothetical protein
MNVRTTTQRSALVAILVLIGAWVVLGAAIRHSLAVPSQDDIAAVHVNHNQAITVSASDPANPSMPIVQEWLGVTIPRSAMTCVALPKDAGLSRCEIMIRGRRLSVTTHEARKNIKPTCAIAVDGRAVGCFTGTWTAGLRPVWAFTSDDLGLTQNELRDLKREYWLWNTPEPEWVRLISINSAMLITLFVLGVLLLRRPHLVARIGLAVFLLPLLWFSSLIFFLSTVGSFVD